jgi:hypothetical protein
MLEKLMAKKMKDKESKLDDLEKNAKLSVVNALKQAMMNEMGGKLKKVSVMAQDKKGLEEGLDKAKEILKELPDNEKEKPEDKEEKNPEHEMEESSDEEMSEHEFSDYQDENEKELNDPEEIDKKIQELLKKKEELMKYKK